MTYNFASIYSHIDVIKNHYHACSHVRSSDIASKVASYLMAFERMSVSNSIEVTAQNEVNIGIGFGKGLWKEIVGNIKIK